MSANRPTQLRIFVLLTVSVVIGIVASSWFAVGKTQSVDVPTRLTNQAATFPHAKHDRPAARDATRRW